VTVSLSRSTRVLLAALAGVLHALALVPVTPGLYEGAPHASAWVYLPGLLQLLAVMGLVQLLSGTRRARSGAVLGFLFALCWLVGSIWWLFISLHRYGGLPAWLAGLAVLALSAALALFMAGAAAAWVRWRGGHWGTRVLAFAALWCLAEWARARWFTGFPWAASGYAHVDGLLAGWAPYLGV